MSLSLSASFHVPASLACRTTAQFLRSEQIQLRREVRARKGKFATSFRMRSILHRPSLHLRCRPLTELPVGALMLEIASIQKGHLLWSSGINLTPTTAAMCILQRRMECATFPNCSRLNIALVLQRPWRIACSLSFSLCSSCSSTDRPSQADRTSSLSPVSSSLIPPLQHLLTSGRPGYPSAKRLLYCVIVHRTYSLRRYPDSTVADDVGNLFHLCSGRRLGRIFAARRRASAPGHAGTDSNILVPSGNVDSGRPAHSAHVPRW